MKKFFTIHKTKFFWFGGIIIVGILASLLLGHTSSTKNYYIIEEVSTGDVSSGITASGTIVAAQKLDLNIYKKTKRIDSVSIVNGQKVSEGESLFTFDSSDVSVAINQYSVNRAEAFLNINEQKVQNDLNNTDELDYAQSIYDVKQKISKAKKDYYSLDFEAIALDEGMYSRAKPKVSGEYNSEIQGDYDIQVYASAADSGYSFRYSGLESGSQTIYFNEAIKVGTRGVLITFTSDIKNGDDWRISVPNTHSETAVTNYADYTNLVKGYENQLAILEQKLATLQRTSGTTYKSIDLQKAELLWSQANQSLKEEYELLDERKVVAPFSGTIEGIENLVVGATPTNSSDDPIQFGTLISDDFYVSFSLNATEVAKVSLGQKVLASVSSSQGEEILHAEIVEISSLPESSATPQYKVNALITLSAENTVTLREGILADVQIITKEQSNVVRVPNSALTYRGKQASILLVPNLSGEQKTTIRELGVLGQQNSSFESYRTDIEVGLSGQFFTEVISGVSEGDFIIVSSSTESTDSVVSQESPRGPGSGPIGGGTRNTGK